MALALRVASLLILSLAGMLAMSQGWAMAITPVLLLTAMAIEAWLHRTRPHGLSAGADLTPPATIRSQTEPEALVASLSLLLQECERSLQDISTFQDAAVATLGQSFEESNHLMQQQNALIRQLTHE